MFNPNPGIFVVSKNAMEQYCREEGIPTKDVPDLVSNDDDMLGGVRGYVQAVRRVLAARKSVGVPAVSGRPVESALCCEPGKSDLLKLVG